MQKNTFKSNYLSTGLTKTGVSTIRLSKSGLLLFILVIFAAFTLKFFLNLSQDNFQTYFFPFLILPLCFVLKREKCVLLTDLVVFFSLLMWALSALHFRGFLGTEFLSSGIFITPLTGDSSEKATREFRHSFNNYARNKKSGELEIVARNFSDNQRAAQWLSSNNGIFLLRGDSRWVDVVFRFDSSAYFPSKKNLQLKALSHSAKKYGIDISSQALAVQNPWSKDNPFLLSPLPNSIHLPLNTKELSLKYLSYLEKGLTFKTSLAEKNFSFLGAATLQHGWAGPEPIALSNFLLATSELILNNNESAHINCANSLFPKAAAYVRKYENPGLFSAIYNNAAVSLFLSSNKVEELKQSEKWLLISSQTRSRRGLIPVAARIAMLNLKTLREFID